MICNTFFFSSSPVNPHRILTILQHLSSNKNNYILINHDETKYYLSDLIIRKLRMNPSLIGRVATHYSLMIYIKIDDKNFVLGTFGANGVTENKNFVIKFPDRQVDNYNNKEVSLNIRVPSTVFYQKNDEVVITTKNVNYLINIFYIYDFTQNRCPVCNYRTAFTIDLCDSCQSPLFGYPKIPEDSVYSTLKYYKNIYDDNQQGSFDYYILYGRFKVFAERRSLNCQSFANFFINLMRGNPFRYTTFIKAHTVVERRLLVMKYLYEINVNFLRENELIMDSDIRAIFKQNIYNYNTLLSKLEFKNYLNDTDSKLHTTKNKIFRTSWWLLRFMRRNYKPITKEEINDFDREFTLEIEGNNYDEPVLNEVKGYLDNNEVDEDPISSDDEEEYFYASEA